MVMGYSKNQKPEGFPPLDPLQTGVRRMVRLTARQLQRRYQGLGNDKVWDADPVLRPFRDMPLFGRVAGYAEPPNRKAAEVVTKYVITDMYAKAIQGYAGRGRVQMGA